MSHRTPRPLAPAVSASSVPTPQIEMIQATARQRRNLTTACKACRKRRTKCDDNTPCAACVSKKSECIRDGAEDGRRKAVWKRKVEELESNQKLLPGLMEAIRLGDNGQVETLIGLIRNNASQEEILDFLGTNFPPSSSAVSDEEAQSKASSRQLTPLARQTRTSTAAYRSWSAGFAVPAKPWTSVTDDDTLVSHLISLWFTWRHWCHPFIERDAFIRAMQSGDEDSQVCTSFLVNMILADACFDYDPPGGGGGGDDDVNPFAPKPLRDLFYEEAKRRAAASKTKYSLPFIQYLAVQWMYLENSGVERLAVAVMYEMVHSLGRFDRRAAKWRNRIAQEQASGAERILGYTSWAAFTSTMGATFAMRKAPAMEPPSRDKPPLCKGELGECWLPYPGDHPPIFAHSDCHLHYLGTLFETCYSISQCLFGEDKTKADQVTRDDVEELHRELTSWHIDLLGCVQINGVKSPHTLSLHAQYHWAVMVLSELSFSLDMQSEDELSIGLLVPVVRAQHMTSAMAIADLLHLQSVYWGVHHTPISFLQPVNAALAVVVLDMESAEQKSSFVKLAIALHSLSRRSVSAEGLLRVMRLKLHRQELMSSSDIDDMFKDADDHWEASLVSADAVAGRTPELAQSGESSSTAGGLSYEALVKKWDHFHVGASSSSDSSLL